MTSPARVLTAAASAAVLALTVSACGASGSGKAGASSTSTSTPGSATTADGGVHATPAAQVKGTPPRNAKVITITVTSSRVSPNGVRVQAAISQPIVLRISATVAGQLHVHTSPEQTIDFPTGSSQYILKIAQPGIVDIEDHALNQLILQVEVR